MTLDERRRRDVYVLGMAPEHSVEHLHLFTPSTEQGGMPVVLNPRGVALCYLCECIKFANRLS